MLIKVGDAYIDPTRVISVLVVGGGSCSVNFDNGRHLQVHGANQETAAQAINKALDPQRFS